MKDDKETAPSAAETKTSAEEGKTETKSQDTETEKTPQTEANTEEKSAETKSEKKPAWFTRVIAREAAEKREAKREAEILKRQNAELLAALADKDNPDGAKKSGSSVSQDDVDKLAERKALTLVEQREFAKTCNKIAEEGHEEFDDFGETIGILQSFGTNYETLLQVATEMTDAHKILHHLGKNPEEAERLLSLPPTKMAIGLAKLETQMSKAGKKAISNAPTPLNPIKPKASAVFDPNDPNADREEWSKWREKTRRKR